jgi:quercetin dioxygenase-like cupin family protein
LESLPSQPTTKGPAEWFIGDVWIDAIARGQEPSRVRVSLVHFTPSARTAWHSHVLGQTLYVLEGRGITQSRGQAAIELTPGKVVYTAPDEEHWHGAAPDQFMAHLSITEGIPDSERLETVWRAHVSDAEYTEGV